MDCIFCQIVAGEMPSEIIYQDEEAIAFRDIRPSDAAVAHQPAQEKDLDTAHHYQEHRHPDRKGDQETHIEGQQ